jgi:flagellar biosynthesis protein FlhF
MKNAADSNMNVRRFTAETSREALRQVRDTLGGDAIILANRTVDGRVEVLAAAPEAVDALTRRMTAGPNESTLPATPTELGLRAPTESSDPQPVGKKRLASLFGRRARDAAPSPAADDRTTAFAMPHAAAKAASSYLSFADELAAASSDDDAVMHIAPSVAAVPVAVVSVSSEPTIASVPGAAPAFNAADLSDAVAREVKNEISREFGRDVINDLTQDVSREVSQAVSDEVTREVTREVSSSVTRGVSEQVTREVTKELRAMQAMITDQLSTMSWTDSMRRRPARTKLMQDLILAGFSPALARHVQSRCPDEIGIGESVEWAKNILKRNLPVATDADELIAEGGVYALVGPTGVGKTTTVAKLAARFALKHGVDQLALITTDGFRIGAQDQLRIYGKILGIPVHSIQDEASLTSTIGQLANKKLVLIDTAGLSQRDERVAEQIAMLRGAKARRLVVLNATSDAETLDHVIATFADREFAACVITKIDEAVRLGPVLDAVIRHRLRIHHVSTGQKVPEDLERPDTASLVEAAFVRPAALSAFSLKSSEEPLWISAMAGRAVPLAADLLDGAKSNAAGAGSLHA